MVHLNASRSNAAALDVAAVLAARHGARVIGIASCRPVPIGCGDDPMSSGYAVMARELVDEALLRARNEFHGHAALAPHVLEWRSIPTIANIAHIVADEARSSDLVIAGIGTAADGSAHADIGDLIIQAGRPVLVVPEVLATADFRTIVIAWKDTRECRRAVADALPLLRAADQVVIVRVTDDPAGARRSIEDVAGWLSRQGLRSDRIIAIAEDGDAGGLAAIAGDNDADLLVAGAYGHSRFREWALGGMTRDMLLREPRCALLSH